jgi:tRNA threonylcarbamoyladenosine biosynthesis protein TsaB
MLILCLDSSGPELKTGLFDGNICLAESSSDSMGNHSERIIFEIQQILNEAGKDLKNIERLAINLGPGSFTGLRIGLAAMAGLSLSRAIPLVGFNAFEIMAMDIKDTEGKYLAVIPCRGDDFYSAVLVAGSGKASPASKYKIISPDNIEKINEKQILIGLGAERFLRKSSQNLKEKLILSTEFKKFPTLRSISHLAAENNIKKFDNLSIPELFYIAPSQAEVNYARKRAGNSN